MQIKIYIRLVPFEDRVKRVQRFWNYEQSNCNHNEAHFNIPPCSKCLQQIASDSTFSLKFWKLYPSSSLLSLKYFQNLSCSFKKQFFKRKISLSPLSKRISIIEYHRAICLLQGDISTSPWAVFSFIYLWMLDVLI